MAYSDYGGYAYRNGERVEERSDAVITPELVNLGQAGCYPGFVAIANGKSVEQFEEARSASVDGHVVLGDGPVLVALYKQTSLSVSILKGGAFVSCDLLSVGVDLPDVAITEYRGERYLDTHTLAESGSTVRFEIDEHTLEAHFEESDNFYQYARLTQPDGTVWTGFSGYGVGAGLEDADYGLSTEDQVSRLAELFPTPTPKEG